MAAYRTLLYAGSSLWVHFWDVPGGTYCSLWHVLSGQLSCWSTYSSGDSAALTHETLFSSLRYFSINHHIASPKSAAYSQNEECPQADAANAEDAQIPWMLQAGLIPNVSVGMGDGAPGCFHPIHGISKGDRGCLFPCYL